MSKYYGRIGYAITQETKPSVYEEVVVERSYAGDFVRNQKRYDTADKVNDNINVSNEISIVADPFAYENFMHMRYITWMNSKWEIHNAEVKYPRINLTIGGVYNGPEPQQQQV